MLKKEGIPCTSTPLLSVIGENVQGLFHVTSFRSASLMYKGSFQRTLDTRASHTNLSWESNINTLYSQYKTWAIHISCGFLAQLLRSFRRKVCPTPLDVTHWLVKITFQVPTPLDSEWYIRGLTSHFFCQPVPLTSWHFWPEVFQAKNPLKWQKL